MRLKSLDVSKAIDKRAEENDETKRRIAAVAAVIREYRERAGMERAQVSEAVVGTPSGACWNWEHQQLPSVEMWPKVKATLGIPDDFDGLIEGDRARFIEAERAVIGMRTTGIGTGKGPTPVIGDSANRDLTAPATPEAERWQGWGTALAPAHEPIVVARKPLSGTVASTVLEWGTGAINIDGSRVNSGQSPSTMERCPSTASPATAQGRWPKNVVFSHNEDCTDETCGSGCPVRLLDEQTGEQRARGNISPTRSGVGMFHADSAEQGVNGGDSGGASRFFYVAKASRAERNAGLEGFEEQRVRAYEGGEIASAKTPDAMGGRRTAQNVHPTVKPIELMRWLCRLVTPPGGTVLDCFAGSGTTGIAAVLEGFNFIGIEREDEYADIAEARIGWWEKHKGDGQAAAVLAAGEAREAVEATGQASFFDEDAA